MKEAFEVVFFFFVGGGEGYFFFDRGIICFFKEIIYNKYIFYIYFLKCNIEDGFKICYYL